MQGYAILLLASLLCFYFFSKNLLRDNKFLFYEPGCDNPVKFLLRRTLVLLDFYAAIKIGDFLLSQLPAADCLHPVHLQLPVFFVRRRHLLSMEQYVP